MLYYDPMDDRLDWLSEDLPNILKEIQEGGIRIREKEKLAYPVKKAQLQLSKYMTPDEKERVKKESKDLDECWKNRDQELAKLCFTKETYQALLLTSRSTVTCVCYLLNDAGFHFVLTRRFSSDKIESHFGAVRQLLGGGISRAMQCPSCLRLKKSFVQESPIPPSMEIIDWKKKKEKVTCLLELMEMAKKKHPKYYLLYQNLAWISSMN